MKLSNSLILALFLTLLPGVTTLQQATAATPDVLMRMRPHCVSGACRDFPLYDETSAITQGLKSGDTLELDIVITNPSRQPIQSIQSWLEYDETVLKGVDVRIADTFPLVAPGEQSFDASQGIVKLGASNVTGGVSEYEFSFARVTFQVISQKGTIPATQSSSAGAEPVPARPAGGRLRFHEFSLLGQEGKTKVLIVEEGRTTSVLRTRPNDLLLYFGVGEPPTKIPQPTLPPVTQPPVSQPPVTLPPGTIPPGTPLIVPLPDDGFGRLQPTVLRVTTEKDKVYLLWVKVDDPRVTGYNIYYGTVSGKYIQRRTVAADSTGVTIRSLPVGKRYFFALTAFNALEQESEFSYEVAVVVGDPASSTAPFDISGIPERPPELPPVSQNGGVPGESGLPLIAIVAALAIAFGASYLWLRSTSRAS